MSSDLGWAVALGIVVIFAVVNRRRITDKRSWRWLCALVVSCATAPTVAIGCPGISIQPPWAWLMDGMPDSLDMLGVLILMVGVPVALTTVVVGLVIEFGFWIPSQVNPPEK